MRFSIGVSILVSASFLVESVFGSYCGQAAVPFSLEILPNGHPVLGCARPSCFGWDAQGKRAADTAQFYRVGKVADGFLRTSDSQGPVVRNVSGFQSQYALCDRSYISAQCTGDSWVGGIAPSPSIDANNPLRLMCCSYGKLSGSLDKGQEEVHAGQVIQGGEVKNSQGRQYAFEYISNVQRLFDRYGAVYIVSMKKFACVPEPNSSVAGIEAETAQFLIENINAMKEKGPISEGAYSGSGPAVAHPLLTSKRENEKLQQSAQPLFSQQQFDLPQDMPQEEGQRNGASNTGEPHNLEGATSQQLSPTSEVRRKVASTSAKSHGVPLAQPMGDDEAEVVGPSNAPLGGIHKMTADGQGLSSMSNTYDAKAVDYQGKGQQQSAGYGDGGSSSTSNQQGQYGGINSNYQYQAPQNQQPYYNNNNNNNNYYQYQYPQQQQQYPAAYQQPQQQQQQFQSMLDPLGMFRQLGVQPNQQPQIQQNSNYGQPQQYFGTTAAGFNPPVAFTLVTPTPVVPAVQQNVNAGYSGAGGSLAQQHRQMNYASNEVPQSMKITIPSPEELENAIPPASKRLIATVTRTLFGYNRFI